MPSAMQKRSYGSVTLFSIDETKVWGALEKWVEDLGALPEVQAIVLFGSLAEGRLSVGSDVDVLVVLAASELPFLERRARYAPAEFPVPVDVFAYTLTEIGRGQPLSEHALATGRLLWCRTSFRVEDILAPVTGSSANSDPPRSRSSHRPGG